MDNIEIFFWFNKSIIKFTLCPKKPLPDVLCYLITVGSHWGGPKYSILVKSGHFSYVFDTTYANFSKKS